jgi:hypothetical protein
LDRYDLGYDENIRMVHVDGYDHKDHILLKEFMFIGFVELILR